jgi:hypothetical protein
LEQRIRFNLSATACLVKLVRSIQGLGRIEFDVAHEEFVEAILRLDGLD